MTALAYLLATGQLNGDTLMELTNLVNQLLDLLSRIDADRQAARELIAQLQLKLGEIAEGL